MSLPAGTRLGPYEIVSPLGAGGMGEVYKARDTQLKRDVALKVLPAEVAGDSERLARFQREAELLAALNHPHIAQIYGVAEQAGVRAIVMELVEGETLAERIGRAHDTRALGSGLSTLGLPIDEILPIGEQLAEALEYAHERGIIHRDLKPANIKLTPDGAVKVLDFGLAKALGPEGSGATAGGEAGRRGADGQAAALTHSPTITSPVATRMGVILGTAAYMSPEQARGAAVDKRADIWAFGAVLFEMLAGRPCFGGETVTDVLAAVVRAEPDWAALPPGTPPRVRELLRRCLAKDRRQRLRDIGDARLDIEAARVTPAGPEGGHVSSDAAMTAAATGFWSRRRALGLAAATVVVTAAAVAAVSWRFGPQFAVPRAHVVRSTLEVSPADELNAGGAPSATAGVMTPGGSRTALAWVPDGSALVFVGRRGSVQRLYMRRLDQYPAAPIDGTVGAQVPAVSPDGNSVAFWVDGKLKQARLTDGQAEPWFEFATDPPFGMDWGDQGLLVGPWDAARLGHHTDVGPIQWLERGSRNPKPVTKLEPGELAHVLPRWLPTGKAFLYTVRRRLWTWSGDQLFASVLATGTRRKLLDDAVDARYVAGHLVFLRNRQLMAVPFDAEALEIRGDPRPMLGGVAQALAERSAGDVTGAGQFAVSPGGALAYVDNDYQLWPDNAKFVRVNRRGEVSPLPIAPAYYGLGGRITGDGRQMADAVYRLRDRPIVVYDTERGSVIDTLGEGGEVGSGRCWSHDSKQVTFLWTRPDGSRALVRQAPDGSRMPEELGDSGEPGMWTNDGRELIGLKDRDIWVLVHPSGRAGRRPIRPSPSDAEEQSPVLSPDNRLLAYASNESNNRFEVYVQPYPGPGERVTVSIDGGQNPAWHPKGQELFFLSPRNATGERHMMSARRKPGGPLAFEDPKPVFPFRDTDLRLLSNPFTGYVVTADGDHFITTQFVPVEQTKPVTRIQYVQNWLTELRALVEK